VYSALYLAPSLLAVEAGGLPAIFGMTLFAAATEFVLGIVFHRLRIVFQPILGGLTVLIVGLQVGIVGVREVLSGSQLTDQHLGTHLSVAMVTLAIAIAASIWGRGVLKLMCSFLALLVGSAVAAAVGLISADDIARLTSVPLFRLPDPSYISYAFAPGLIPAFVAAGFAATLRAVGVVTTAQRINDATWTHPDMSNLRKGILADALGCAIGGLLGAPGMNTGPSLVSVSGLTGATSRAIAYASAFFLLVFALLPPFSAAILILPPEVAGASLVFTGSVMVTGGMQLILSRVPDRRGVYVIGLSHVMALSRRTFPEYFAKLPVLVQNFVFNELAAGLITAIVLTLIFRFGTKRRATLDGHCHPGEPGQAEKFITDTGRMWSIPPTVIGECVRTVHDILSHIHAECVCSGLIRMNMSYDGIDLGLAMRYDGRAIAQLPVRDKAVPVPGDAADSEEAAAQSGLEEFLRATSADWRHVAVKDGFVEIRLRFAV
jgi:NCS2 family nucleobase:cation symporter-2